MTLGGAGLKSEECHLRSPPKNRRLPLNVVQKSPRTDQQGHRFRSNLGKNLIDQATTWIKDQLDTFKGWLQTKVNDLLAEKFPNSLSD